MNVRGVQRSHCERIKCLSSTAMLEKYWETRRELETLRQRISTEYEDELERLESAKRSLEKKVGSHKCTNAHMHTHTHVPTATPLHPTTTFHLHPPFIYLLHILSHLSMTTPTFHIHPPFLSSPYTITPLHDPPNLADPSSAHLLHASTPPADGLGEREG